MTLCSKSKTLDMRVLLITISIFIICVTSYGQKIVEKKIDDFTGDEIISTSWEPLRKSMKMNASVTIRVVNGLAYIGLKTMFGSVYSIGEGDELMFKLKNEEIISVKNLEYTLTCTGCGATGLMGSGAPGTKTYYPITKKQLDEILASPITKVRVYLTDGYKEDKLNTKNYQRLKQLIELVYEEVDR
jgi:hypothetical protein